MKKVLVIAYLTPPAGGAGVQRTAKFIRYLPEFGWQPVILTVRPGYYRLKDQSLSAEIPPGVVFHRTRSMQLPTWVPWRVRNWVARWVLVVDEHLGWYPFAVQKGMQLIESEGIAAIYSTSAPYTAHLIGDALHQHTRLPWIADLRDPWIGNFSRRHPTRLHQRLDARLEARVMRATSDVLVTSQPNRNDLLARYPELRPDRVTLITNGYDQQDFTNVEPVPLPAGRFTILYSGSFYTNERSPQPFLSALKLALDEKSLPPQRIQVIFVGNISPQINQMIEQMGLSEQVQTTGYLPHRQNIAYLLAADLLLLIMGRSHALQGMLTGKVFEYLAAGKPILALAPECADAELLREAQAGVIVPPEDIPAIASALVDLYIRWAQNDLKTAPRPEVVARYERRNLTARLANILDNLTETQTIPHS